MLKIHPHHFLVSFFLLLVLSASLFVYSFKKENFSVNFVKAEGNYSTLGTPDSTDGSADALNFSQGNVLTLDNYGKYIMFTQDRNGNAHFTWSNDNGTSWTQGSESYNYLIRGSIAYDSKNDILHVIWTGVDSNDGIIYRRYSISRDGTNNITSIQRVDSGTINLQLDLSSSRALEEPSAIWYDDGSTYGILVAIWTKNGSGVFEARASMRKLTNSAADGVAGNWTSPDGTPSTFSTDPPLVAADLIASSTAPVAASSTVRGGNGLRKNDLYVFVYQSNSVIARRAIWNQTNTNWSGGWQSPITMGSVTTTSGYNLKYQLITKPVLDTANDRLYIGWPTWKDNTLGDTVTLGYLNSSDTPSANYDFYSANGTHNYAPTLDIGYDSLNGYIYASYIESTTNGSDGHIFYRVFDGINFSSPVPFFTLDQADIPLFSTKDSIGRLLMMFRRNGSLPPTALDPHTIYSGYIPLTLPSLQFTTTAASGDEGVTNVNIQVSSDKLSGLAMTINYAVTGGTATGNGTDFSLASGVLTIPAGSSSNNIALTIVEDNIDESDETIEITLSSPINSALGSQNVFTYTINDNDLAPTSSPTPTSSATPTSSTTPTSTTTSTPTATASAQATSTTTSTVTQTITSTTTSKDITTTTSPTEINSGITIKFNTTSNQRFFEKSDTKIIGETSLKEANVKLKIEETGQEFNVESDNNGKFVFTLPNDLKPGKYTLTAYIEKENKSEKATITFEVTSTPDWTWLWVLIGGIVLLIIGIIIYKYRKKRIEQPISF